MKPIFDKGPSIQFRLFLSVILSASLMFADSHSSAFYTVRYFLNSLIIPLQYIADMPRFVFVFFDENFNTKKSLIDSNRTLKMELLLLKSDLMLLNEYKKENKNLRKLLEFSLLHDEKKIVTEVMAADTTSYRRQILINKGHHDGVYEGQPVISEDGIVGQVASVNAYNSRVLLLTDNNSAIPVQAIRNGVRAIASGTGNWDWMQLEHISITTDIQEGDLLVTSGLGGVYPQGYPVAYVNKVEHHTQKKFVVVRANPVVDFERLRYLLLLWPAHQM
ncbi:rod shape-determining protein [Candidatus Photodesmus katoptron]|uniref:Cell shape-determining protein MreC n=1 Tax=Candidatus Photodesmus katoptron Akat1 TaxID=1236703 RepID=S3DJ63_9GAMM|nr:rod shape-determining protein MreC [Candidatus Photodesmus katoptron]EPE37735.1 rod shape-determining protein MreC [Candidatus Photodesmus katoptron Akat1]KEY90543.1 rod shape-determining protein [Candidatus Photodesmus katoptron]